jgi:TRAP-type C4-dicarboxylate transport system permease small subunit
MIKIGKMFLCGLAVCLALTGAVLVVADTHTAMAANSILEGAENVKDDAMADGLVPTVKNIINTVLMVVGIIAVAFLIYGGVQYITSAGQAEKIKTAKNTILYSVIGLIVCILAFAIVNFVVAEVKS